MSNRPWTPGPWKVDTDGNVWVNDKEIVENTPANLRLAEKAPEMAELLIRLSETKCVCDLAYEARGLLKELGYEPEE